LKAIEWVFTLTAAAAAAAVRMKDLDG